MAGAAWSHIPLTYVEKFDTVLAEQGFIYKEHLYSGGVLILLAVATSLVYARSYSSFIYFRF